MKNLKNLFLCVILIFMSSLTFSSNENSKIYLNERRREPAKITIGVTKLKTKELPMKFDVKNKIIYTELPQELNENDLIYVSETLDEIPSTSTTNGRKSINNIKKYLTKEVKSSSNFNYQIIKGNKETGIEEGKRYLIIKCKNALKSVYIYVVENGSYKVKNIYRGSFKTQISTLKAIDAGQGNITFDGNKILYTKEILGTYNMTNTGVIFTRTLDGKKVENPDFIKVSTPNKFLNNEKDKADKIEIISDKGNSTGEKHYNNEVFDLSLNITNGNIRVYTTSDSSKVNFDLKLTNWDGNAINEKITIQYIEEKFLIPDNTVATQTINISIPAFSTKEPTAEINISNPIVQYEKDGTERKLGRVFIKGTSSETVDKAGAPYTINGDWISGNITGMNFNFNNGNYNIKITSTDAQNTNDGPVFSGTSGVYYTDFISQNEAMWQTIGKEEKLSFGVHTYNFKKGSYSLVMESYDKKTKEVFQRTSFKVNFPDFDGTVYLDKTLEIGNNPKFEKEYEIFSAPNGKILLGSVGLKSLDRRITYAQNGGDGVSVRLLDQKVVLKKIGIDGNEYTINGTLTIEENDSLNNQVRGITREDTSARKGNVYLTLTKSEEEKLAGGGRYHILTADNREPLQVGVKANTGEFFKPVSELWLITTEKYNKVKINFKNDGMPLITDKGWIDYINGTILGYTGNWGDIAGNREIPKDTTEIYLLDETGKKLISGKNWEYDVPIGKSSVTVNFDGTNLKFGVKEGHYFVGEKGKFFLRYVDTVNKKYLKIEEVDVEFILNKLTSNATLRFLNPMMAEPGVNTASWFRGAVTFGAITNGEVITTGNHSYTHSDAVQWWEVKNAQSYKTGEIIYEIYNEKGVSLGRISPQMKKITVTPNKVSYHIMGFEPKNIEIGIHKGYDGHSVNDVIYLVGKNPDGTVVRYEKINIEIDEFEPNAYGFLAPVENGVTVENNKGHVGIGTENLKEDVTENVLIDLGTNFRFYSRLKGIIECMQSQELDLQTAVDVIAKPVGDDTTIINGKLKLVKGTENVTNITMPETINLAEAARPKHYSLKFEVSPEEYKKLTTGTEYQIFKNDSDYHTLTIGLQNISASPLRKNLKMDKALNFRTTGSSIEIKVQNDILDFGKININEKTNGTNIIREGYTYVTVTGNGIKDFSVTPNNNQMGEIYLTNADSSQDTTKKLQVSRLKAEKVSERQTADKLIRVYNLNGIVTVPKNSTVGEYTGQTVVNVTIIN